MIPVEHHRGATEETSVLSELIACAHAEVQPFLRSSSQDLRQQLNSILINRGPDYLWSLVSNIATNSADGDFIDPNMLLLYASDNMYGEVSPDSLEFRMLCSFPSCAQSMQGEDGKILPATRLTGSEARIVSDRIVVDLRSSGDEVDAAKQVMLSTREDVAKVSDGYRKLMRSTDPVVRAGVLYVLPTYMLAFLTRTKKLESYPMAWLRPRLYLMIRASMDAIRDQFPEKGTAREWISESIDEAVKRAEGAQKIW